MNTGESCGTKDESDGESGDGEYGEEFDSVEDESDKEFVFNDLDEKSNPSPVSYTHLTLPTSDLV